MRTTVFRILAELLAIGFTVFLSWGSTAKLSLFELWGAWMVTIAFGLFALLGTDVSDRFLMWAFSIRPPDSSNDPGDQQKTDDSACSMRSNMNQNSK